MEPVKYRVITTEDEITVICEDGGVACIREIGELDEGDGRMSTTDYYQSRFTQEDIDSEDGIWEAVGEGKMYYNNWTTPYNDPKHIKDALEWLNSGCEFIMDTTIWPDF